MLYQGQVMTVGRPGWSSAPPVFANFSTGVPYFPDVGVSFQS